MDAWNHGLGLKMMTKNLQEQTLVSTVICIQGIWQRVGERDVGGGAGGQWYGRYVISLVILLVACMDSAKKIKDTLF